MIGGRIGRRARAAGLGALALLAAALPATAAEETLATGSFEGASGHKTSGQVSIEKGEDGFTVVLHDNFRFDGAPDPKLGLGKDGYAAETQFSRLRNTRGGQTYTLPAGIDPANYNEVWLWCERYNVPLGVAALE